jgi:caffeoyl-CoA O-methyltransferase
MASGSEHLRPNLHEYLVAHSSPPDALLRDLIAETAARFPDRVVFQIGPEQGTFMTMLASLMGARQMVEVGTFTGYSSLCLARGLADGGKLLCCDVSEEWTLVARKYWKRAGLDDRIELRLGPAIDTLRSLPDEEIFDLAFIDADKGGYLGYWREVVPRVRPGGLIMVDNTFSHGRVIDAGNDNPLVIAVRDFNDHAAADDRVDLVMVPIGDGLTLARKRD